MKRIILAFLLSVLIVVPASADEVYNFLKQGYGFILDESIGAVGLMEPLQTQNPPFDIEYDMLTEEVSWAMLDMAIDGYSEVMTMQIWDLVGGTIAIYYDDTPDLDYGTDPADGIATATDGEAILTGTVYSATYIFNTATEIGNFSGTCIFTGGTRFGELGILGTFDWEIFDGISAQSSVNVPPGYHSRFAGRIFTNLVVPVEGSTLSKVKALY